MVAEQKLFLATVCFIGGVRARVVRLHSPRGLRRSIAVAEEFPRRAFSATQIAGKRPHRPLPCPAEQSQGAGGIPQNLEDLAEKNQTLRLGEGALDRLGRGVPSARVKTHNCKLLLSNIRIFVFEFLGM